ncbi:MAG: hypothetical protein NZ519_10650, partial [Bacteroidia bacterium]|nr:hypothetical protein [Bacteroidia bacterium]
MKKSVFIACFCFILGLSYTQTTLVDPTAEGGFELGPTFAANGWTVVNGGTNEWYVGAVGVPFAGTRCAYISNTGGATYNYDVNSSSVVHFYRDISFPAAEPNIQLSFRWKGQGEGGFDYIRVYLVPISVTPVAGILLSSGQIGGNFNLQGTYQLATLNLPCSAAGTTMRLVFSWRNDGSIGTQPPGAIDNIQVTSAPAPCNLGAGVINVPALPYSSGAGTTCGQGDDQTGSNSVICGNGNYYGGEDVVWVFTPTAPGDVIITLTSSGTWTGLMLYQGCPMNCGTCVASAQSSSGNKTLCVSVVAGQTYYLILDSWPSPTCNPYSNLSITAPSSLSVGCNLSYTVSSIPYAPESWTTGTNVPGLTTDDVFSSSYVPINFSFCFDANTYTQCLVSANGYIIFDPPTGACSANMPTGSNATPGGYSGWSITAN